MARSRPVRSACQHVRGLRSAPLQLVGDRGPSGAIADGLLERPRLKSRRSRSHDRDASRPARATPTRTCRWTFRARTRRDTCAALSRRGQSRRRPDCSSGDERSHATDRTRVLRPRHRRADRRRPDDRARGRAGGRRRRRQGAAVLGPADAWRTARATCARAAQVAASTRPTSSRDCSRASRASRATRPTRWSCCRRSTRCTGSPTAAPEILADERIRYRSCS